MSGHTPRHAFTVPNAPAEDCQIPIDQVTIDALRGQIPVSRAEAMRWVDDDFARLAEDAYVRIGSPDLSSISTGWSTFSSMANTIQMLKDNLHFL